MRLRGLWIGVFGIAALAGAGLAAWPLLSARAAAMLEDRLQRETGIAWRIGGLGLGPTGLVLEDVAAGGAGAARVASIRRVRVSGSLALLLGWDGTSEVAIEGVSLRLPLDPPGAGTGFRTLDRADLGLKRLHLTARGTEATRDGRTLSVRAECVDVAFEHAAGSPAPALRADLPERGLVLEADPPAAGRRPVRLAWNPGAGPRVAATAQAVLAPNALRLEDIAGRIDQAPFAGGLAAEASAGTGPPRLTLDLRLDALALAEPGIAVDTHLPDGLAVPVRGDLVPDAAWFAGYEGQAHLVVKRLLVGSLRLAGTDLTARVKDGILDAALDAAAYEGTARGRYVLAPEGVGEGRHQLGLSLTRVRVLPLLSDLAGLRGLDGTGSLRLDVQARGNRPEALLRSAQGQADLSVVEGRIDGLDLARAAGLVGAGGGLATRLDRLAAGFTLTDGQAVTNDLALATALIEAQGAGSLDLPARTLDLRLKALKVVPGGGGRLDVPIRVAGPWQNPAVSADLGGLARDPVGTLQTLQDLGSGLLGQGERDGGGDALGGFGGLIDSLLPRAAPPPGPAPRRRP